MRSQVVPRIPRPGFAPFPRSLMDPRYWRFPQPSRGSHPNRTGPVEGHLRPLVPPLPALLQRRPQPPPSPARRHRCWRPTTPVLPALVLTTTARYSSSKCVPPRRGTEVQDPNRYGGCPAAPVDRYSTPSVARFGSLTAALSAPFIVAIFRPHSAVIHRLKNSEIHRKVPCPVRPVR